MSAEESWPSRLPAELKQRGIEMMVINGSVSGDTTGNGLDRLPALLEQHTPDWILVELGANDGLRGFPPEIIKDNLEKIILLSRGNGTNVALMQIQIPPNYGKRYTQALENIYPQLARQYQLPLLPFFLRQIILKEEWMMSDGLHPKAEAQPWIAGYIADSLTPYL